VSDLASLFEIDWDAATAGRVPEAGACAARPDDAQGARRGDDVGEAKTGHGDDGVMGTADAAVDEREAGLTDGACVVNGGADGDPGEEWGALLPPEAVAAAHRAGAARERLAARAVSEAAAALERAARSRGGDRREGRAWGRGGAPPPLAPPLGSLPGPPQRSPPGLLPGLPPALVRAVRRRLVDAGAAGLSSEEARAEFLPLARSVPILKQALMENARLVARPPEGRTYWVGRGDGDL